MEYTDADRTFSIILEITSDGLMTCNNNFLGKDEIPLILDTSNLDFPDLFSEWFTSMDSIQINRLKNGSELHISVETGVTDTTIENVKSNVIKCGIEEMAISNFLTMNLTLRPYKSSDATTITLWIKNEYLMCQWCADRYEH